MKQVSFLKLLIGISIVSISCHSFLNENTQGKRFLSEKLASLNTNKDEKSTLGNSTLKNTPVKEIRNDPVQAALNLIKNLSVSSSRVLSSDKNGWVIDDQNAGFIPKKFELNIPKLDLLNCQTALVLDDKLLTLSPIRPRSSNGPPLI
jgi:hypothetical protein